jgi:hypothetical protein
MIMASFEMDFVFDNKDGDLMNQLAKFQAEHGLDGLTLLKLVGPAGGHPTIEVNGSLESIIAMIDAEKIDDELDLKATPAEIKAALKAGALAV